MNSLMCVVMRFHVVPEIHEAIVKLRGQNDDFSFDTIPLGEPLTTDRTREWAIQKKSYNYKSNSINIEYLFDCK